MGLEFRILGPLEVRLDGTPLQIGGPRQRALLAVLLLSANRVVSRDRLIDELLPEAPVDTADHQLRVQVSRLRRALRAGGRGSRRLLTRAPGYVLQVGPGELDLHRFEQLLRDGDRALEQRQFEPAAAKLRAAESLWRGRPLADLEFEPFARVDVERLQDLRLVAKENRIEAELALGRHAMLVPELEGLVGEYPLRERLRGQLMLALYRCGRQADALETYRAGRMLLSEELALDPSPALRQLEQSILRQEAGLDLSLEAPHREAAVAVAAPVANPPLNETLEPAPYRRGRRPRGRAVGLVLGMAAVLAAVGIGAEFAGSAPRRHRRSLNRLALVAPRTSMVASTIPLRGPATQVAVGFGSVWISEARAGVVVRVDEKRRAVLATIPVGTRPGRIVAAPGRVWVLDSVNRTVSSIDPKTNAVLQTIAVRGDPSDLLSAHGSLWVANRGGGTVMRIDPSTGRTQEAVRTRGDPSGLAIARGAVWVADDESGMVDRIDTRTNKITDKIRVGDAPTTIVASQGAIWVLDPLDATASRIDPRRDAVVATIPLGGAPADLVQAGGYVWVADKRRPTLLRINPRSDTVIQSVHLAGRVSALAAGPHLWAAVSSASSSHRGGTLSAAASYQVVDTVDPAAGTSNNVSPPQFLGMTNDGLVSIDHVSGSGGTRLVPDLALSLPIPRDGGRTYTFRLRPGIRYSTGRPVMASDVTRSFERLFSTGSSGTSWYQSIAGARACLRRPAHCNLSRGIAADDRTGSVTFHLMRPDPDFLYKLTLTYAYVLPGSTPDREARSPLPATGPYEIRRYIPGREVVLVRNPRFREWSAAAQPDGYPDRVLLRLDLSGTGGAAAIAHARSDFMANLGEIPGKYAAYFLRHHRGQVRVNPLMETSFMFLNVRVPPFNHIRVRQALNLALDRARIVHDYGGPVAAGPTCQVLPPAMPGYRRYCPYTRSARGDGRWLAPDLSRARQLVAASGTVGAKVTVWNTPAPEAAVDETRETVTALRQLGYRASLRLLPDSTYFTFANDSRNRAQVVDGGWSADYASANDFIGKLSCNYFVPGDGEGTTDASEFCDPAVDRQVTRADSLQTTDPRAAAASWARIDRELTNRAILLPTVTPNELDLIARRVGDYQYNPVWGVLFDQLWVR